jgi:hypothetical protein
LAGGDDLSLNSKSEPELSAGALRHHPRLDNWPAGVPPRLSGVYIAQRSRTDTCATIKLQRTPAC